MPSDIIHEVKASAQECGDKHIQAVIGEKPSASLNQTRLFDKMAEVSSLIQLHFFSNFYELAILICLISILV